MSSNRDSELIQRCRRGDRIALGQLIEEYQRPVYNAAYRIAGSTEDAADITQAVFLKVFERLEQYDPKYKFFSWIYRIAINESINYIKRSRNQQPLDDNEIASTSGPEDLVQQADMSRSIQDELMELGENYRVVIVLKHFSDCSYRQISEILHIPEKTVKSRLYSARQILKENLQSKGFF
jgi:RNA polymerase sigma-70 factor (ECF subfamily)